MFLILVKTLSIAFITSLYFPFANSHRKESYIQSWVNDYLSLLGVQTELVNEELIPAQSFLFVANHVSWLDFFVLQSLKPSRVVAKTEIANLPFVGKLAKLAGIIFTDRHKAIAVKGTIKTIASALARSPVCIFPEGTTHLSGEILPFKSCLFESAVIAQVPVIPLVIKYVELKSGERSEAPSYFHASFGTTLVRILMNRPIKAILEVCPPATGKDRRELANNCQRIIYNHLKIGRAHV